MIYKIYISGERGYELLGRFNLEEMFVALDHLIIEKDFKKEIMVIQYDKVNDCDTPIFLNIIQDYNKFKEEVYEQQSTNIISRKICK